MILAIPLNHLPSLTIEDRVMRWADAVIKKILVSASAGKTSFLVQLHRRPCTNAKQGSALGFPRREGIFL